MFEETEAEQEMARLEHLKNAEQNLVMLKNIFESESNEFLAFAIDYLHESLENMVLHLSDPDKMESLRQVFKGEQLSGNSPTLTKANQLTESSTSPPKNPLINLIQTQKKLYFLLFKFLNHSSEVLKQSIWNFIKILPSPTQLVNNIINEIQNLNESQFEQLLIKATVPASPKSKLVATFNNRRFSFENNVEMKEMSDLSFEKSRNMGFAQDYLFSFCFSDILKHTNEANLYKLSVLNVGGFAV